MSVSLYLGKTESGKSFKANLESYKYKKVAIYDNTHCFTDGEIITDFSPDNFARIFKKYALKDSFRLIFRAPFVMNEREGAEMVARLLYSGFGMFWKQRNVDFSKMENRLDFLVDEADKVSSLKMSGPFYLLVTKGRHFGIDTHAISQGPGKIPSYYKENASEVFCFSLRPHEFIVETFGRAMAFKIQTLPKYHYAYFKDTGDIKLFNEKGKAYGKQ